MDTILEIASLVTCITNNTNLFGGHHNYTYSPCEMQDLSSELYNVGK